MAENGRPRDPFEDLSLDDLRARRSEKWQRYPPDVLPAWVAEMDFPLAPCVRDALLDAVERGDTGYASHRRLGEAFAGFADRRLGWAVDPARVTAVPDVMTGVAEVLRVLTRPGEPVVINPPVYPPFFAILREVARPAIEVPLTPGPRPELDLEALEHAFAAGARAYLLCSPHNPVGRVWSRATLEAIAELAAAHDVLVLADEIHAPLTLAGATSVPFAPLAEAAGARAVSFGSASKAFNVPGLKCAVLTAATAPLAAELKALPEEVPDRVGHLGVLASEAAFADGDAWLDALLVHLDRNRAKLGQLLRDHLPRVRCAVPEATYLAWLDCRELDLGDDPAAAFLERGRVALVPGHRFGDPGRGFVRLNLGTSGALLAEAVRRMASVNESIALGAESPPFG